MVHLRLNEKESNPNPHINFTSALPCSESFHPSQSDARDLLRALAAQLKPVMKDHGLTVNSLEEYEFNTVFAGRNWEAGETVELVLRRPEGTFYGVNHLINVFCHELAHIKHMNHLPAFQKLWAQLRSEVYALQRKGYFGDGYWSSGQRLQDSTEVQGQGINGAINEVMPEYVCGGAHAQKRSGYLKSRNRRVPRKPRGEVMPSNHTGAQTAKRRKAGARVTKTLPGEGVKLSEEGGSKGKRASSNRAREERAAAAERRLQALQGNPSGSCPGPDEDIQDDEDDADLDEFDPEDDDFRRTAMKEVMSQGEMDLLRTAQPPSSTDGAGPSMSKSKQDRLPAPNQTSTARLNNSDLRAFFPPDTNSNLGKRGASPLDDDASTSFVSTSSSKRSKQSILETEIQSRKKESLGLNGSRVLGGSSSRSGTADQSAEAGSSSVKESEHWTCAVCTLINHPDYKLCEACSTRRGEAN